MDKFVYATDRMEAPERIWIESDGECPYFYREEELSDVAAPVTEYVRADKLRAEIDALRAEVAEWKLVAAAQSEAKACAERLAEALRELEEREKRDEALLRQALEALEQIATEQWRWTITAIRCRGVFCDLRRREIRPQKLFTKSAPFVEIRLTGEIQMRFRTSLEYSLAANAEMLTYRLRLAKTAISRARIWAIASSTIAILEAIYIAVNCF